MRVKVDPSALKRTKWQEYTARFVFGGLITGAAGIIAKEYGAGVGGLFLAFPAIFPASATLIEKHEQEKKKEHGLDGTERGREAASVDAAGSAMGSIGLLLFALLVWQFMPSHKPWLVLAGATLIWFGGFGTDMETTKATLAMTLHGHAHRVSTVIERSALYLILALTVVTSEVSATLIPVKHKEGTSHGFIVLRSQEGRTLASGDVIQTVEGERVTSEVILHFTDGSIHDETTVFSQKSDFRLIAYHLRQQGPSFPKAVDVHIDAAKGDVEISTEKGGEHKSEQHHLQIPEDASNGMTLALLKNISPSASETTISRITTSSKPKVVKLTIHAEGEQQFSASGERLEAIHYVIHTDIGAVAGAIASVRGKRPLDNHVWIVGGKAPVFVKFTGQLYADGPIWNVELATVKWENKDSQSDKH